MTGIPPTSPLEDHWEEHGEVADEAALMRLFLVEQQGNPAFSFREVTCPSGRRVYTSGTKKRTGWGDPEPEYAYEEQSDGAWVREPVSDLLQRVLDGAAGYLDDAHEDRFHEDFWADPVVLYHGTNDLAGVLAEGIHARAETRGLGNRGVGAAVFASLDVEGAESYGHEQSGGVVAVDAPRMKADGYAPRVTREPEVSEQDAVGALAHRLGVKWECEYQDAGIDPQTVVIHGHVPREYLTVPRTQT